MVAIYAFSVVLIIFTIGEIISSKTNALLSQPFVAAVLMLGYYWLGFPSSLVPDAGFAAIGSVLSGILIVGVGSSIKPKELAQKWKAILISVVSVSIGVIGIILIGALFIGKEQAIAGAPIFAGSIAAVIIMSDYFNTHGLEYLSAFASLLLIIQTFVGLPLSTIMMRRAAACFLKDESNITLYSYNNKPATGLREKMLKLPASGSAINILAKLAITAGFAYFLSGITNGTIHYLVMALFLGVIFTWIGFVDENAINKTGFSGLFMVLILSSLFHNFSRVTPQDVLNMLFPLIVVLGVGSIITGFMAIIMAKITKVNSYLAIAMSLTCMYGFPTTLFISQDIARAYSKTEDEHNALANYLVPNIVTAGIATVTIASVIIASLAIKLL